MLLIGNVQAGVTTVSYAVLIAEIQGKSTGVLVIVNDFEKDGVVTLVADFLTQG